jgi:hypothetical protein
VYLLQGPGRRYKIGRTNAFGRRRRELSIQLPFDTRKVHVIETDDPEGVEAYWHHRFAEKRINSEWFEPQNEDVAAAFAPDVRVIQTAANEGAGRQATVG